MRKAPMAELEPTAAEPNVLTAENGSALVKGVLVVGGVAAATGLVLKTDVESFLHRNTLAHVGFGDHDSNGGRSLDLASAETGDACEGAGFEELTDDGTQYEPGAFFPKTDTLSSAKDVPAYIARLFEDGPLGTNIDKASLAAVMAMLVDPSRPDAAVADDFDHEGAWQKHFSTYIAEDGALETAQADCQQAFEVMLATAGYKENWAGEGESLIHVEALNDENTNVANGIDLVDYKAVENLSGMLFQWKSSAKGIRRFNEILVTPDGQMYGKGMSEGGEGVQLSNQGAAGDRESDQGTTGRTQGENGRTGDEEDETTGGNATDRTGNGRTGRTGGSTSGNDSTGGTGNGSGNGSGETGGSCGGCGAATGGSTGGGTCATCGTGNGGGNGGGTTTTTTRPTTTTTRPRPATTTTTAPPPTTAPPTTETPTTAPPTTETPPDTKPPIDDSCDANIDGDDCGKTIEVKSSGVMELGEVSAIALFANTGLTLVTTARRRQLKGVRR